MARWMKSGMQIAGARNNDARVHMRHVDCPGGRRTIGSEESAEKIRRLQWRMDQRLVQSLGKNAQAGSKAAIGGAGRLPVAWITRSSRYCESKARPPVLDRLGHSGGTEPAAVSAEGIRRNARPQPNDVSARPDRYLYGSERRNVSSTKRTGAGGMRALEPIAHRSPQQQKRPLPQRCA